jgi:uncharacterized protein YjbI with pentapeptide repeats
MQSWVAFSEIVRNLGIVPGGVVSIWLGSASSHQTNIRRTNLSGANLEGANLSYAGCKNTIFRGVNFKDAILEGTILVGADLSDARNLTREQLAGAIIDDTTILPPHLKDKTRDRVISRYLFCGALG